MTSWSIAVPWKDNREQGLKGVIEVTSSEFPKLRRVWELVDALNKKVEAFGPHKGGRRQVKCLLLHGMSMYEDTSLTDLLLNRAVNYPRLVAVMAPCSTTSTPKGNILYVKTASGRVHTVQFGASTSLYQVKFALAHRVRIPVEKMCVYLEGVTRVAGAGYFSSLASCNISSGDTIYLTEEQVGGGGQVFADVSDASIMTKMELSDEASDWRVCSEGLNIEGVCPYPACEAYGRMIIHRNGFEAFNLKRDWFVRCPVCAIKVKAITCGFYDCVWRYEGVRSRDGCFISSEWKVAGGNVYHRFDADEEIGSIEWDDLLISTKPRPEATAARLVTTTRTYNQGIASVGENNVCSVCHSRFGSRSRGSISVGACGHSFHGGCFEQWSTYCSTISVTPRCPICRKAM